MDCFNTMSNCTYCPARQPDSRGSTPLQDNDFISSSTNDPPAVSSTVGGLRPLEGRLGEITRTPGGVDEGPAMTSGAGLGGTRALCQNFEGFFIVLENPLI